MDASAHLFLDLGLLAAELSQIVQFRSSDLAAAYHLDLLYVGRIHGPCLLDTDSAALLTHRKGSAVSAALNLQNRTLEDLNPGAFALLNTVVDTDCVTDVEFRNLFFLGLLNFTDDTHFLLLFTDVRTRFPSGLKRPASVAHPAGSGAAPPEDHLLTLKLSFLKLPQPGCKCNRIFYAAAAVNGRGNHYESDAFQASYRSGRHFLVRSRDCSLRQASTFA